MYFKRHVRRIVYECNNQDVVNKIEHMCASWRMNKRDHLLIKRTPRQNMEPTSSTVAVRGYTIFNHCLTLRQKKIKNINNNFDAFFAMNMVKVI